MNAREAYLTVAEAALRLGISERAVLKRIHHGRMGGKKEGKSWLVEDPAAMNGSERLLASSESSASSEPVRNFSEHSEPRSEPSSEPSSASRAGQKLPPPPPAHSSHLTTSNKCYSFQNLGAWNRVRSMVVKVLRALDDDADGFLKDRARDAVVDALTCLAQGYHSYHLRDKIAHYAKSREMLCAAASLLTLMAAGGGEGERLQKLSVELQGEPLGSVTGLIRALETKKRKQHGAEDAGTGNLR